MREDLRPYRFHYGVVAFLTVATFVLGLVLLAKIAPAQTQSTVMCFPDAAFAQMLKRMGEKQFAVGLAEGSGPVAFYANPNTGSWTVSIRLRPRMTCLLGVGTEFQPVSVAPEKGPAL